MYEIFSHCTYLSILGNFNHYAGYVLASHGYLYFHEIEKAEHFKNIYIYDYLDTLFCEVLVEAFCSFFYWEIFLKFIVRNINIFWVGVICQIDVY